MGDFLPLVDLGTDSVALTVAAAGQRTCAILEGGSLKCWGENSGGQLGLEDSNPRGVSAGQMGDSLSAVNLGTNRTAVALARTVVSTAAAATGERKRLFFLVLSLNTKYSISSFTAGK